MPQRDNAVQSTWPLGQGASSRTPCATEEGRTSIPLHRDGQAFHFCALKFDLTDEVLDNVFIRLNQSRLHKVDVLIQGTNLLFPSKKKSDIKPGEK